MTHRRRRREQDTQAIAPSFSQLLDASKKKSIDDAEAHFQSPVTKTPERDTFDAQVRNAAAHVHPM
ncbi:MAG: hypothetical protein ABIP74_05120 [Candidatus Saccharimonas sp.]